MMVIIHTDTENMMKSINEGIIRIPKNLIKQFDLRKLKVNDNILLFNFEDNKLYGVLKVIQKFSQEKNPKLGPFNGYGRVKNHYYYYSVKVDTSSFFEKGLHIKKIHKIDLNNFFILDSLKEKLIEILRLLNKRTVPLIVETKFVKYHFIVSLLNVNNGVVMEERKIEIDRSFISLLKKKTDNIQKEIDALNYDDFLSNFKDIGEYLYEKIFRVLKSRDLFHTGGYTISFVTDENTFDLPLEFVYCCDSFLFEKNIINYLRKNKENLTRDIAVNKILIIADPGDKYKWSYKEGIDLFEYFSNNGIECDLISRPISDLDLLNILENYQLVHITGHGENYKVNNLDFASFDLGENLFHIKKLGTLKKLPSFFFFNICNSSIGWGLELLNNRGIGNIILSRWNFPDADNMKFIFDFYDLILKGVEIGKAFNAQKIKYLNTSNKKNLLPFLFSQLGDATIKYVF